jgi:hypothetical protein
MWTTMKNNLLRKKCLSCSFYLYRFRKCVSYGFPIINFCNPGVYYETPCIIQIYQQCDKQRLITAEPDNVPHLLEDKHSPLSQCLATSVKSLLVSVCNSLCSVTFKVLRASWVIATDSVFKKSHQKEVVRCREIWWSWWPSPRLIMWTPKNFCKKAAVVFAVWARLAKPETPSILFQQTSELS